MVWAEYIVHSNRVLTTAQSTPMQPVLLQKIIIRI